MRKGRKVEVWLLLLLLMVTGICGCNSSDRTVKPKGGVSYHTMSTEEPEDAKDSDNDLYLVLSVNSVEETMVLYSYQNDIQYQFHYGLDTEFLDKYGNHTSVVNFESGKVVKVGKLKKSGSVSSVQISDQVWEYDDITRFSMDEEKQAFKIADSNYAYDQTLFVFSGDQIIGLGDLTSQDTLSVIGKERKILSVMVTTGHGTLALKNTELFDGSYLQLDNKVFAEVSPDMSMELPEGTYNLAVANDGWGGNKQIEIVRGETTEVDLDALKGEGPKYGKVLFSVDVEDAVITIDGTRIEDEVLKEAKPVELKYGRHSISVTAPGYDTWSRYLYVNSSEATILIELADGETTKTSSEEEETQSEEATQNQKETEKDSTETKTSEQTESEQKNSETVDADYLKDYLSTLSQMLSSITD